MQDLIMDLLVDAVAASCLSSGGRERFQWQRESSGIFETEKCRGQISGALSRSTFTATAKWILCSVDSSWLFLRKKSF